MVKLKIKKSHLFLIIVIIFAVIFAWFNSNHSTSSVSKSEQSKEISKDSAYYKCLKKSKECSEGIPAVRLEFMKDCKDIYLYTADAKELLDFTSGMC